MPWLHRYVGNPVLSGILNLFFKTGIRDAHCGMRGAAPRRAAARWTCARPGMEFASEMVIRASKEHLDIREFPIEYHPRGGESKLSSFRDGWRHLRFLLVHSPTHLFMIPGAVMAAARRADRARWSLLQIDILGRTWDLHTMIAGALLMIVGSQVVAARPRAPTPTARTSWARRTRGSTACGRASGSSTGCCSAAPSSRSSASLVAAVIVGIWINRGFGALSEERLAIARGHAHDRRHPDLLLVVPAQHPRPAPAVRTGAAEARQLRQRVLSREPCASAAAARRGCSTSRPGPIGSRDLSPAQVADAVLAITA